MSPLREAFCDMMAQYPGPDATMYANWARSGTSDDATRLLKYVRDTARAIRYVSRDEPHNQERPWLPLLDALGAELETGRTLDETDVARLADYRARELRAIRAREVAEVALGAAGGRYDSDALDRAVAALIRGGYVS